MQLVPTIMTACPFGSADAAQRCADDVAAAMAAQPVSPLALLTGSAPVFSVEALPDDTPYGPWFAVKVQVGAEVRYIADN